MNVTLQGSEFSNAFSSGKSQAFTLRAYVIWGSATPTSSPTSPLLTPAAILAAFPKPGTCQALAHHWNSLIFRVLRLLLSSFLPASAPRSPYLGGLPWPHHGGQQHCPQPPSTPSRSCWALFSVTCLTILRIGRLVGYSLSLAIRM